MSTGFLRTEALTDLNLVAAEILRSATELDVEIVSVRLDTSPEWAIEFHIESPQGRARLADGLGTIEAWEAHTFGDVDDPLESVKAHIEIQTGIPGPKVPVPQVNQILISLWGPVGRRRRKR